MPKRWICIGLMLSMLLLTEKGTALARPDLQPEDLAAQAAFLVDVDTGKILFEKNADVPFPPASTTKILTVLLLLETADQGELVRVGEEITRIGPGSSVAKLKIGDLLTVAELAYALMLPSGNDAAYTAAVFVGRRVSGFEHMDVDAALAVFSTLMNRRAVELGAVNSNFIVPDGYDTPGHVSTARDLAAIALVAYQNTFLRQVAASQEYCWQGICWTNTNHLLKQDHPSAYYPWATGFKTGYTAKAGHCLVATARGGGRELLGVILKSKQANRWLDTRDLLEYGFNNWRNYAMFVEGRQIFTVPVISYGQKEKAVQIVAGGSWSDLLSLDQIGRLSLDYVWQPGILREETGLALKGPLAKSQVVGCAVISLDGEFLGEVKMITAAGVGADYRYLLLALLFIALAAALANRWRHRPKEQQRTTAL